MNFSIQQIAIFTWFIQVLASKTARALVIRARAGTGKTTTVIEAVKRYLLAAQEQGKRVEALVCAFAKINADEAMERLQGVRGASARTLHSLGNLFVMRALGNRKPRNIESGLKRARYLALKVEPMAPDEALDMITELNYKAREIESLAKCPEDLRNLAYKFECVPDGAMVNQGWTVERICDAAFRAMQAGKGDFSSMDYADMIFWPLVNRWTYPVSDLTVVDEAQDMTESQLELALCATREDGHVILVGDDKQAIYGFRGADSGSLDRLKAQLGADELGLTVTYRCAKSIVAEASHFVPDYQAAPDAKEGIINRQSSHDKLLANVAEGDYILARTNAPLASLCLKLIRDGFRAYIRGREIGKGITAVIKKLRVRDIADLAPVLAQWRDREIARLATKGEDGEAQIETVKDKAAVIEALSDGCTSVSELMARIESMFQTPAPGERDSRIMLATVHKAKGLEAERVWLLESTFKRKGGEEDNIRYVAITRAKSELNLVLDSADARALAH